VHLMRKKILLVCAHPEPTSLTRRLFDVSSETLAQQGHELLFSDLYGMRWKAVFDAEDFPDRANSERLSFIDESAHAYSGGSQTADVMREQEKIVAADVLIFHFPLWWFSVPAILKGWFERVWARGFAYGYRDAGNLYRYGDGALKGKRALLAVSVGGAEQDYSPRGINGPLDELLFPITHGTLFFPGMDVLPTFAVYGAARMDHEAIQIAKSRWRARIEHLFQDPPIAFRPQNGGDYPDRHMLASHVAVGQTGLRAHIADHSHIERRCAAGD